MSKLVIVESPTKEKTISRFLQGDFVVKSSYGHVRDLPANGLGVKIEKNFEPFYVILPKARKILSSLKKVSAEAEKIYLATDYDREGEAIAWHLSEILKLPAKKTQRITFHEITPEALKEALSHPRSIDQNLVDSQQARRVLDRLFGYQLSPWLWRKVQRGLSAGRVQSIAVRLICDREEEINKFVSQEYWTLTAELKKEKQNFFARLISHSGGKYEKLEIKKETVDSVIADLTGAEYIVVSVEEKERRRNPFPPYTTSTLQQDASRHLGFSASRTMRMAQSLYEGITLGAEGSQGLITYMRTDSFNVAASAQKEALAFIQERWGKNFLPSKPRHYKTKSKTAQEAHEAIRPTFSSRAPEMVKKYLSADEYKLYDLIWRRFLASQMADALYDTVSADIQAKEYIFRATGRTLKFSGFLEVYEISDDPQWGSAILPPLFRGDKLLLQRLVPEQHFTEPPPRYNEASLIKTLEENGIGRPSTYAPTIATIQERGYVRLEERRFYPTELGKVVNTLLKNNFSQIVDTKFTATIEEKLDGIAEGKEIWNKVVADFYQPFAADLLKAEKNTLRVKIQPQNSDEKCEKCGSPMLIRENRRGKFLACSAFPQCRNTIPLDREGKKIIRLAAEKTNLKCEKCGKMMVIRTGPRGNFLACSGFPKCRNTRPYKI